ncbi:MAG: TetR/AcrR family transcriptional regulator [Bacteroidia bacterium]|nr:TetR/AcrR family transcriptional regulator [Bacteroidia bacterium]
MGRKSKAGVRRQEILSNFYEVIIEEGLEGATIAKIGKKMGVNPSLILHYYADKASMLEELIRYIVDTYASNIIPEFGDVSDPRERWEDFIDVVYQINWERYINCGVFYSCYVLALRDKKISQQFSDLYARLADRMVQEIEHATQSGVIAVTDARLAAETIVALLEGTNFYQYLQQEAPRADESRTKLKGIIQALFTHRTF